MRHSDPPVRSMVAAREYDNAVFVALELSRSRWLLAISLPHSEKVSKYRVAAADTVALLSLLSRFKMQAGECCDGTVRVVSIHEAGLDGFWVHRLLQANPVLDPRLTRLSEALIEPSVEVFHLFVACFSERRDDLSQWRAYSGGEGGYAIQFVLKLLREAGFLLLPSRDSAPLIMLARVGYDPTLFDGVMKWTERYIDVLREFRRPPMWAIGQTNFANVGSNTSRPLCHFLKTLTSAMKGSGG